jgi:arginine decarboxylase
MRGARWRRAGWSSASTTRLTAREQALQMFNLGLLSLEHRGLAERLYWATCAKIRDCCAQARRGARGAGRAWRRAVGHLLLQFLGVPVAARQLGHRPAVSDHAHPPPRRTADAQGRARRHHLRFGRQDRPLRQPARCQAHAGAAPAARRRGLFPRGLPGRRLPGDARRPAQPVRRHPRGAHKAARGGGWWIEEIVKGDTANKVLEYMEYDVAELYPALARTASARCATDA